MRARRRVGLGLFASGAVHAAAAAIALWLADREPPEDEPDELEWADIEIVEDPEEDARASAEASAPAPGSRSESSRRSGARPAVGPRTAAVSETRSAAVTEPAPGTERSGSEARSGSESAPPHPPLDPRRAVEGVLLDPGPPPPPGPLEGLRPRRPQRPRSELRPDGAAGVKTDEDVFVARGGRDGTVSFEDRPNLRAHLDLPTPSNLARGIEGWYDELAPGRGGRARGKVDPDGPRAALEDRSGGTPPIAAGSFDLTDAFVRGSGQDPYAARKLDWLDRTRAERMQIALRDRSERLRHALHRTGAELERLWRGPGSPAEKRELIFLLWDECAERGPDEVVRTARAVRGAIAGFVRRRLPAGSDLAYTAAELARHNARRTSAERFDPYAPPRR